MNSSRKWPRVLLGITIVAVVVFFGFRAYYRWTDDFRIANITPPQPSYPQWETEYTQEQYDQLANLVKQKFTYVGKGAQAYAFASEDRRYVIKFFKFKHLKPNLLVEKLNGLPFVTEYCKTQTTRKKKLIDSVFCGHKLAYDVHRNESALLFVHLNKTSNLNLKVHLVDKIGLNRTIDLDSVVFVVQRYADTTRIALTKALENGNVNLAKELIDKIIVLYLNEYEKEIYDRDHGVMHNTGFVDNQAIHLDVGKLTSSKRMKDKSFHKPDLEKVISKFEIWMRKTYPQHYDEIVRFLESRMTEIFNEPFAFRKQSF